MDFVCMRNYYCVRQLKFVVCHSSLNLLPWLLKVNWTKFVLFEVQKKKKRSLTPRNYPEHSLIEHQHQTKHYLTIILRQKQDHCIIMSEHREKCKHCLKQKNNQTSLFWVIWANAANGFSFTLVFLSSR